MLGGGKVKRLYELHGRGESIRAIAKTLGISRNTVRRYLRAPEVPRPAPRAKRGSKLDPYVQYIRQRLAEGVENCVVLLREIRAQGYTGGYTILKDFVQPLRRRRQPPQTVRFEVEPGEQAQIDFGQCWYEAPDGRRKSVWAFVMVLSWSRAMYVEFVQRADLVTFIRCHLNAFAYLGGIPERCLYDNSKLVVIDRDEDGQPIWNTRFLDFSLRLGFDIRLCRPYRAQTKGRVESGIKYVKYNFWPSVRFVDLPDLNRQALVWCETEANVRIHGTTHERPIDRLVVERARLRPVPEERYVAPFLRVERRVGRDGYVQWERGWYGLPWPWRPGQTVQVQPKGEVVGIWSGDQLLAIHPKATRPGQRFTHPRQWDGLPKGDARPRREPAAVQVAQVEVERRPLAVYEALLEEASGR